MGNSKSSQLNEQQTEKVKRTKMEKMRSALKTALTVNKDDNKDKSKKRMAEVSNNNNGPVLDQPSYYHDNITRSATLPAYTNGRIPYHSPSDELDRSATLKPRLLPAYKGQHPINTGTLQYRQRIMSSPSYSSRPRTSSQGSSFTRRHNDQKAVSTYIPERLERKMVRSRSVGIIPDTEIKMRQTKSASVVKLSEVEDWIV